MTDPLSCYIGRDLGRSQNYSAAAIDEEPVWIEPDSEHRLVVPRRGQQSNRRP